MAVQFLEDVSNLKTGLDSRRAARRLPLERYVDGVLGGDRMVLARAITADRERSSCGRRSGGAPAGRTAAAHRPLAAGGNHRRAGSRQEHLYRCARHAPDPRSRRERGGAERRPVEPHLGRQHSGRQDPHGATGGGGAGVHSALAIAGPPGRRGPPDAGNHPAVRSGRLSQHPGGDGGRRTERRRRSGR